MSLLDIRGALPPGMTRDPAARRAEPARLYALEPALDWFANLSPAERGAIVEEAYARRHRSARRRPSASSQRDAVLEHLRERGPISALEALEELGIMRLGARVYELRALGHDVRTTFETNEGGKRYARYALVEPRQSTMSGVES